MEKKNKDILKKGLMETKLDFTSNLMDKITAEEKALSTVLSKNGSLETSKDFTVQLMSKLEGKIPSEQYAPIISKRAWIGIAAVFTGVILLALLTIGTEANSLNNDLRIDQFINNFTSFIKTSPVITYTSIGLLLLTLSLLFEQKLRRTTN